MAEARSDIGTLLIARLSSFLLQLDGLDFIATRGNPLAQLKQSKLWSLNPQGLQGDLGRALKRRTIGFIWYN